MENSTILTDNVERLKFSWYDYVLFSTMLVLSALIGVYFGFIKKQSTASDYLLGGRNMSAFPVSMSLIASLISGVTLLAVPADIYRYGVTYWFCVPMLVVATIISYYMFVPVFYELQVTSVYEYLKQRFDSNVRTFASALFTFSMLLYLPIVIYIPALALEQATGINLHLITPIICGVCIFYTTLGGLKAVVWTDALQLIIMIGTIIVVLFLGLSSAGGFTNIWQKSKEYQRLDLNYSLDPTIRDTFWAGTIGIVLMWLCFLGNNQGYIQKCIALPNYRAVRNALIIFVIGMCAILSFAVFSGLIMFTKYLDCDPLTSGKLDKPDQLLPYYIMDISRSVPGLPGLFISGIFSAALSTLSACMNSLAATIYEDFISGFVSKDVSQKTISNYLKLLAVAIGVICTSLIFFIPYLGSLLPLSLSIGGATGGSLFGVFASGLFLPSVNAKGALWGGIVSLVTMMWIVSGAQYYKTLKQITYPSLPLFIDGCQNFTSINISAPNNMTTLEKPFFLYRISYYYYALLGMTIAIVVSLIVSKFTPQFNKPIGRKYFSPVIRRMIKDTKAPPDYNSLEEAVKMMKDMKNKQ